LIEVRGCSVGEGTEERRHCTPAGAGSNSSRVWTSPKYAIEELPKEQQAALAVWLAERDQAAWDAEIERDFASGGAGFALLEEMKADIRAGKFRPYEESPPPKH
jgi:hypothetical protein